MRYKISNFFYRYAWVVIVLAIISIPIVYNIVGNITPRVVEEEFIPTEEIIEAEVLEEVIYIAEHEPEEPKVFEILWSDFQDIHTNVSAYLRNHNCVFNSSEIYGAGDRIVFEIVPNGDINKLEADMHKNYISNLFREYGYDIDVILLVLDPKNYEIVIYTI